MTGASTPVTKQDGPVLPTTKMRDKKVDNQDITHDNDSNTEEEDSDEEKGATRMRATAPRECRRQ